MLYTKDKVSIGVGNLPGKKRKSLYVETGCSIYPVATFTNDEQAQMFSDVLEYFLGMRKSPFQQIGEEK